MRFSLINSMNLIERIVCFSLRRDKSQNELNRAKDKNVIFISVRFRVLVFRFVFDDEEN